MLEVSPSTQNAGAPVTTSALGTSPSSAIQVESTTTTSIAPLTKVFVATDGNDRRSGAGVDDAVKTLDRALGLLAPGGTVQFTEGVYEPLTISNISGAAGAPIRLTASGRVEFRDTDYRSGAGILVENAAHIEITGMNVRQALWGIYVDNSQNIKISKNDVSDIGQEGIRVKGGSSQIRIEENSISLTGRRSDNGPANGEGIYIGTGSPGGVDLVTDVLILNNEISQTTDEAIDIKSPSTDIVISGNSIRDIVTQTSGAVVIHLNNESPEDPRIVIDSNTIRNVTRSSPHRDGNCIVAQTTIRVVNNVLSNCQHRGIYLRGNVGTATILHNTLSNTGPFGAVATDDQPMTVVSNNNIGIAGDTNIDATEDLFIDAAQGDYRPNSQSAQKLRAAGSVGVATDIAGVERPTDGPITFGAYEIP